jgi:glycosyltransferase involved in cell wall biosynthesis
MRPFSVVAPLASADGYGVSAEQMVLAAKMLGEDIELVGHDWQDTRFSDPRLLALRSPQVTRNTAVVHFLPFAFTQFRGRRTTIGSTMFETDSIPPFWVPCCNATDGVIVPSEHCQQAFQPHLDVPVEVVPLGVDAHFYWPAARWQPPSDERGEWKPHGGKPFTFLMAGLLHYRKGAEFAVKAFLDEFDENEEVRLILKTRRGFLDVGDYGALCDDRIEVIDEDYTREEMRTLYWRSCCFLAPSRGEASGLTPREAMATALPTILTDWGGLKELCDERYSYPVEVECLEPAPPECSSYDANVAGRQPIGNFARPSVVSLRARMREVYENPPDAFARGHRAAKWMQRDWTWAKCAIRWLDVIETMSQ